MQKVILLNFEQNDQEGGKWARPRYAGPHWNEQDCSHSTKMFMKYYKFEDTRRVLCTRVREIQRFQSLPESVTQPTRNVLCTRVREIQRFQNLWQSVTQLAAKCDSMGDKAEMLHSAKEGYIECCGCNRKHFYKSEILDLCCGCSPGHFDVDQRQVA